MDQLKAREHALRIGATIGTADPHDAARDLARLFVHREQYIAELRSAALSGERIDDIHVDCRTCEQARIFAPLIGASITTYDERKS